MGKYKPTGYPRGRPRKGEVRPATKGGLYQAKLRARRGDAYREYNRIKQAEWREANPERRREQERAARIRAKEWKKLHGTAVVVLSNVQQLKRVLRTSVS